jgi:hypothetical protein
MEDISTGDDNAGVGSYVLNDLTTGSNNCALGKNAGNTLTTGSNNILLGHDAEPSSATVDNEVTIGDTAITKFRVPGLNFVVKDTTATEDYVLTVDANGEAGWEAAGGGGATGAGGDSIFWENGQTVTTNYTITNNTNAGSFGPIAINSGITVTVGAGENWTII